MKKYLGILVLMFLLCSGFTPENYEGTNHFEINTENKNIHKTIRKTANIKNSLEKDNRITANSMGEKSIEGSTIEYWDKYTNKYIYNQLPDKQKQIWDNLDVMYQPYLLTEKDYTEREFMFIDYVDAEIYNSIFMYLYCHPQYFFLRPNITLISYNKKGAGIEIAMYDEFKSGEKRKQAIEKIQKILDLWTGLVSIFKTDYEKIKATQDVINTRINYDYAVISEEYDWVKDPNYSQSIYSGITTGKTVCAGYTKLFSCITNALGLTTVGLEGSGHAWNMAKVGENWYYLDTTWDDTSYKYKYFLVTKDVFESSHTKSYYWNKYVKEPEVNYHSLRYEGDKIVFSHGDFYLSELPIFYILGEGSTSTFEEYTIIRLVTCYTPDGKTKIPLYDLNRAGYKFKGWYYNDNGVIKKVKRVKAGSKIMTFEAHWEPNTYNISFKKKTKKCKNKVKGGMETVKKVEYDSTITLPKCTLKSEGYEFMGWTDEKNGDVVKYTDGSKVFNLTNKNDKTVKLYGVWKETKK